jgi:Acyl dehydratase
VIAKGTVFNHTFTVTEEIYSGFLNLFNDKNPLHTDEEFAKQKGFNSRVMHGNILNGFISYFVGECLPFKNVIILSQEIKYYKPVYMKDILQFTATVDDYYESVKIIEFVYLFTNRENKKIAKGKISVGII